MLAYVERSMGVAFRPTIMGTHGMVATEHYLSAFIGAEILRQGGNAVDAAVCAIFSEGGGKPHMHTPGGGDPLLVFFAVNGQGVAVNRHKAPPPGGATDSVSRAGL